MNTTSKKKKKKVVDPNNDPDYSQNLTDRFIGHFPPQSLTLCMESREGVGADPSIILGKERQVVYSSQGGHIKHIQPSNHVHTFTPMGN